MQTVREKIKGLKIKRIGCACLLLALLPAVAAAGAQTLDEQVDRIFRDAKTVGGAFLVAQEGEIVYERYYGEQQKTTHVPVTEKSYFRCASVTKLVTGIGLMRMMDDGLLDPDEDISAYLGYEAGNPRYPDTPITLRMLEGMTIHFDRVRALSLSVVKDQKIISDHLAICDAIERRDVAAAQAVMTKHLSRVNVDEATIRAACPEYIKN